MFRKFLFAISLLCASAHGATLEDSTNLVTLGIPDVLANEVEPYDSRIFDINRTIDGVSCCQRDMYRYDGYKIVLLSHQGQYFIAFLLTDNSRRYFVAGTRGNFVEQSFGQGTEWQIPDWIIDDQDS